MNREALGAIGEIAGAIGVIATLGYLTSASRLVVKLLPGDHFSSLPSAVQAYISLVETESR